MYLIQSIIKRAQKFFPTSVPLCCSEGSQSTQSNHLWYYYLDVLLLWHSLQRRGRDHCIWCPLKSSYAAVSVPLCILTVVIIFAINLSWHDNLHQFYLRCFHEPLLSGVARRYAFAEETRDGCIQHCSLSTLYAHCSRMDLPLFLMPLYYT